MKNQSKNNENVIPFPNLKDRLVDKGLDALKNKRFKEALALLKQAQGFDKEHHDIELGIVICLFELGEYEEAKENCSRMLKQDVGDYYQVLQIYLMILVQLGEYEEVKVTIEAVLEENSVPVKSLENLENLLQLSKKMIYSRTSDEKLGSNELNETIHTILLEENNLLEQLKLLQTLKDQNVRNYLPVFQEFLIRPDRRLVIKTILLQLLITNEISDKIDVEKNGQVISVTPADLVDPSLDPFAQKVLTILDQHIHQQNPTLFESAKEIWLRHLFVLFPFTLEHENPNLYAAALHAYCETLLGMDVDLSNMEDRYDVEKRQIESTITKIENIEKNSFLYE